MHRSPLSEQYERIMTIVDEINSWPDDERNFLLDRLDPKEEARPTRKKSAKKSASKSSSKSARASGMAAQLSNRRQAHTLTANNDDGANDADARCEFIRSDGRPCKLLADHNIHHLKTANEYHPFVSGVVNVGNPSSPKSESESSTVSSSAETGSAQGVAAGLSGGN